MRRVLSRRTARRNACAILPGAPRRKVLKSLSPALGVPVPLKDGLKGIDSLLSIVQMPGGIPVGTLAVGEAGAKNAALLAAQILALSDPALDARVVALRQAQTDSVPETVED
jgi:5-(carboxyamino)imidazole ribonucleotide mutase